MRTMSLAALALPLALSLGLTTGCKKQAPPVAAAAMSVPAPREAPASAVQELRDNFARVHFDTDSATLDASTKAVLSANATIMQRHADLRLEVQGHCDERGTTDYNLALGQRRAKAVRDYLVGAGVAPSRVQTVSLGEERPLANGHGEVAWAENRRAEFRISQGDTSAVAGSVATN